jgi:hypothetical protein
MSVRVIDLDLDLLRCFLTVVESGGFTPASKRLHLTQSAITLKIKRLEDLLERRLFFPTRPGVLHPRIPFSSNGRKTDFVYRQRG